jgi:hypothetical protein
MRIEQKRQRYYREEPMSKKESISVSVLAEFLLCEFEIRNPKFEIRNAGRRFALCA